MDDGSGMCGTMRLWRELTCVPSCAVMGRGNGNGGDIGVWLDERMGAWQ